MIGDIEIDLPTPITSNHIWQSTGRRVYRSNAYKAWIVEAERLTMAQRGWRNKKITGRFRGLLILNERLMRGGSDIDNRGKVCLDFAKKIGLIVDDSKEYCRRWTVELGTDDTAPTGARLILTPIE